MRKALAAIAVLAVSASGCREGSPPGAAASDETVEWTVRSPDDRFEVTQARSASGCRVKALVRPGDRALWTTPTCVATQSSLVFVSPDGERLLVLDLFPTHQDADWSNVPLLSSWSLGAVVRRYSGAEILPARRVVDMRHTLSWVRGRSFDEVRKGARTSADGTQLTIDLVDGGTLTLGFDGAPLPAPRDPPSAPSAADAPARDRPAANDSVLAVEVAPVPPPARVREASAGDEQGLYRWEDEAGQLHFGSGAQVPARYRRSARPVSGSVGVIPLDHLAPTAAGAAAPNRPAPGAPAAGGAPPAPGAPAPGAQPGAEPAAPPRAPDAKRER
jgi:hypothetical protein